MSKFLSALALGAALLATGPAGLSAASEGPGPEAFEGLWAGQILYAPAQVELELWVELATDAEGNLVGNLDVPSQKMKFYPLTSVEQQGHEIKFDFHKDGERKKNAHFFFEGKLSEDGTELSGIFTGWHDDDGNNRVPFELKKTDAAFGERPEPVLRPLVDLASSNAELKEVFNEDADNVRLVMLLSPT